MVQQLNIQAQIRSVLRGGDILLIVPPFATVKNPVLGVHILQNLAEERSYTTDVLYLNLLLASVIGVERFEELSFPIFDANWRMLHERLFARSAYGLPPLGTSVEACRNEAMSVSGDPQQPTMFYNFKDFDLNTALELEEQCYRFVIEVTETLREIPYTMVGCSQREGQTNCSIALLREIKRFHPETLTLIGGTNCKGELARGIASLSQSLDYVFSGESERAFCDFLTRHASGNLPVERVIRGEPLPNLDRLAMPDYRSFFEQTEAFLGQEALTQVAVSYETSRGCWWRAKQGCSFCGERDVYRQKSASKVLEDIRHLCRHYETNGIFMCDVGMPPSYLQDIFPQLLEEESPPSLCYQAKANLSLPDLLTLKKAGITRFTIGIEAFSDSLLQRMHKGSSAGQNLQLLRYARSLGIHVDWLLLWGFPGDSVDDYQRTLELLPLLHHFQPPLAFLHLILTRFSPYFERAQDFHITNIRPWAVYGMIYPEWADLGNLATWFVGEYPCGAHEHPDLIRELADAVAAWRNCWQNIHVTLLPFNEEFFMLLDNRALSEKKQHIVEAAVARTIMTDAPYEGSEAQCWAVAEKLAVVIDSRYIPLITAAPELLLQFEKTAEII